MTESLLRNPVACVAQMLSTHQELFLMSNDESYLSTRIRNGELSVTPELVRKALRYREVADRIRQLALDLERYQRLFSESERQRVDLLLEEMRQEKERLEKEDAHVVFVERMLCRLEVWGTKVTARHFLVHASSTKCASLTRRENENDDDEEGKNAICKLLNLPLVSYFQNILPPLRSKATKEETRRMVPINDPSVNFNELPLPPTAWTWQEYHRLIGIMSRIPGDFVGQVRNSQLTMASTILVSRPDTRASLTESTTKILQAENPKDPTTFDLKLFQKVIYTQTDLVALWIRAQRNTRALLQLIQLFEIVYVDGDQKTVVDQESNNDEIINLPASLVAIEGMMVPNGIEETLSSEDPSPNDKDSSHCKPRQIMAKFVGNSSFVKKLVLNAGKVDDLIEFVVTNHVLHTQPVIHQAIEQGKLRITKTVGTKKTSDRAPPSTTTTTPSQGSDMDISDFETENQDKVSGMPLKRPSVESKFIPPSKKHRQFSSIEIAQMRKWISYNFIMWFFRRNRKVASIHASKIYYSSMVPVLYTSPHREQNDARFWQTMLSMAGDRDILDNFSKFEQSIQPPSPNDNSNGKVAYTQEEYESARQDASSLFALLRTKSLESLEMQALAFVDSQAHAEVDILKLAEDEFRTERSCCPYCSRDITGSQEKSIIVCSRCDRVCHEDCAKTDTVSLKEALARCKEIPKGWMDQYFRVSVPDDFNKLWISSDDANWDTFTLEKKKPSDGYGVTLKVMSRVRKAFMKIMKGSHPSLMIDRLFVADVVGLFVFLVNSAEEAGRIGLRVGDIITSITTAGGHTYSIEADTTPADIAQPLKDGIKIVVKRLKPHLMEMVTNLLNEYKRRNALPIQLANTKILTKCKHCRDHCGNDVSSTDIAANCRAVVRRVGTESYSTLEMPLAPGSAAVDAEYMSLPRLDRIFSSLMMKSKSSGCEETECLLPFCTTEKGGSQKTRLLNWAKSGLNSSPLEVLRLSIGIASCRLKDKEHVSTFIQHLLSLIAALCVDDTLPMHATSRPWLGKVCPQCFSPALEKIKCCDICHTNLDSENKRSVFQHELSRESVSEDQELNQGTPLSTVADSIQQQQRHLSTLSAIVDWEQNSSLVGSMILVMHSDSILRRLPDDARKTLHDSYKQRPICFIVVSCLPMHYVDGPDHQWLESAVVFDLLPVLDETYIETLQPLKMRNPPENIDAYLNPSWTKADCITSKDMVRLPGAEVHKLLLRSQLMLNKIEESVMLISMSGSGEWDNHVGKHESEVAKLETCEGSGVSIIKGDSATGMTQQECEEATLHNVDERRVRTMAESLHILANTSLMEEMMEKSQNKKDEDHVQSTDERNNQAKTQNKSPVNEQPGDTVRPSILLAGTETRFDVVPTARPCVSEESELETCVLVKDGNELSWGFDIDRWPDEPSNFVRVGAIDLLSSAGDSGLQEHDIIQSIDDQIIPTNYDDDQLREYLRLAVLDNARTTMVVVVRRKCRTLDLSHDDMPQAQRHHRRYLRIADVDGRFRGSKVTILQAACVIQAFEDHLPNLGRRLLVPEMSWDEAGRACRCIQMSDKSLIPRLPGRLWEQIKRLDYIRSRHEEGPIVTRDGEWTYAIPTQVFSPSLDEFVRDFATRPQDVPANESPALVYEHPALNASVVDPRRNIDEDEVQERIRGGRPGDANTKETENEYTFPLTSLPKSSWMHQAVIGRVESTENGIVDTRKVIAFVDDGSLEDDGLNVSIFWVERLGEIHPLLEHQVPSSDLFLVTQSSEEGKLVSTAIEEETIPATVKLHSELSPKVDTQPSEAIEEKEPNQSKEVPICEPLRISCQELDGTGTLRTDCKLCGGQSESIVRHHPSGESSTLHCHPLGCAPSSVCCKERDKTKKLKDMKSLLLQVAEEIPPELHLSSSSPGSPGFMWGQNEYQKWCSFVESSFRPKALIQAFVILIKSIKRSELPFWWHSEHAGWSQPMALSAASSMAALALSLYVLDLAMTEVRVSKRTNTTTDSVDEEEIAKKMMDLVALEMKNGGRRYEGPRLGTCEKCNQTGEQLLNCEFCSFAYHPACCDPPIEKPHLFKRWVCQGCEIDVRFCGEEK